MPILAALAYFLALSPLLALLLLGPPGLAPMLANPVWVAACLRSLLIAEVAVPIALFIAVPAALAVSGAARIVRWTVLGLFLVPLLCPPSWTSSGLADAADHAHLAGAHIAALIAAHAAPSTSLAFLIVYAFLRRIDPTLLQACAAAGASPLRAWRMVVFPVLAWAMPVAAVAAFAGAIGTTIADARLAPAFHPTLGAMLAVATQTSDAQAAPAALVLALLAVIPLCALAVLMALRRR